jgi:cell pole-organizing protein PopZ
MEEILASIRQIISEDGESSETAKAEPASSPIESAPTALESIASEEAEPEAQSEPEPESAFAQGETMTPQSSGSAAEIDPPASYAASTRKAAPAAPAWSPDAASGGGGGQLLSAQSGNAVHGAFSALAHTILAQNARTLEDLVAEMLQPMLRSWLDDNLPTLVERLVQEEIQRVSRGR